MKTYLDWSSYQDAGMGDAYADIPKTGGHFAKAVAVCINSRGCQNYEHKGVMCPSFRVSGAPALSTGGRVRLLKAALNSEAGAAAFAEPELAQAMDLCVSCKGCKRECENEVDMAMIKIEYLAQRQAREGVPWRARLFAAAPLWLHYLPWLKPLMARRNRSPRLAQWGEKLLGISARRRLPVAAAQPFSAKPASAEGREVVLLVDTLSRHYEPDIAEAALAVLEAAGYRVILAEPKTGGRPLCCGRTWLGQGMVDEARAEARRMLDALLPHAEAGRPIIGLEPSCLLALRDEYKALGLGEAAATVAKQALLFEEFIAREQGANAFKLALKAPGGPPVLVHGHCHAKAVGAMKSMRKVLKLIPGLQFELIEASCCGMAGSFGLEAEHVDISLAMAGQSVLKPLGAAPEAALLANGFSCRQQIRDTDGRHPVHLAQLFRAALR